MAVFVMGLAPPALAVGTGASPGPLNELSVNTPSRVDALFDGVFLQPEAHVLRLSGPNPDREVSIQFQTDQAQIVVYEHSFVRGDGDVLRGVNLMLTEPNVVEKFWVNRAHGSIYLDQNESLVLTTHLAAAAFDSAVNLGLQPPILAPRIAGGDAHVRVPGNADPFRYSLTGWHQPFFSEQVAGLDLLAGNLLAYNASLHITHANGTSHFGPGSTWPEDAVLGARRWVEIIGGLDVRITLHSDGDVENTLYGGGLRGVNATAIAVPLASGDVSVETMTYTLENGTAYFRGLFEISSRFDDGAQSYYRLAFAGDVVYAYVEGQEYWVLRSTSVVPLLLIASLLAVVFRDFVLRAVGVVLVPLYTKLRKPNLLDHDRRQSLYDSIKEEPGVTFLQLHQRLQDEFGRAGGFGFGALTYHLSQLERFGLIVSKREGRFRRYFENGGKFGRETKRIAILQTPPVPSVVEILLEEPGASQTRIHEHVAQTYPVTRQAVGYHLKRLQKQELLDMRRAGKANAYFPTPKLEELAEYAHVNTASLRELQAERTASG